jgi:hypothetical protein
VIPPVRRTDRGQQNKTIIWNSPAGSQFLPSNENYKSADIIKQYHDMLTKVLGAVLPSKAARDSASKLADQIIAFEVKLIDAVPPLTDMREPAVSHEFSQAQEADE